MQLWCLLRFRDFNIALKKFSSWKTETLSAHIPPEVLKKLALRWSLNESAREMFVHLVWLNKDDLSSGTKYVLALSFSLHLRANFLDTSEGIWRVYMPSLIALCGSKNKCARTDTVFVPISQGYTRVWPFVKGWTSTSEIIFTHKTVIRTFHG